MKFLITGCAGFIGSHLTNYILAADSTHQVVGIDNLNAYYSTAQKRENLAWLQERHGERFVFFQLDIRDQEMLKTKIQDDDIAVVVHLAASAGVRYSLHHPQTVIENNIIGTVNMLEFAKAKSIKHFHYASSSSVYGLNRKLPFSEKDPINTPNSPYAVSKISNEHYAGLYTQLYGLHTIGYRFFTVYGPRGRPDMAPYKFMKSLLSGEEITLYGDGQSFRDYTFVTDIVNGVYQTCLSYVTSEPPTPVSEVYNIGRGQPIKLLDFIKTMERVTGCTAKIKWTNDQLGDVPTTWADVSKLKERINYQPETSLEDGLQQMLDWMQGGVAPPRDASL